MPADATPEQRGRCSKCGAPVVVGAKFCHECGAEFVGVTAAPVTPASEQVKDDGVPQLAKLVGIEPGFGTKEEPYRGPWYFHPLTLAVTFLFVTPVWAILILLDKRHTPFIQVIASLVGLGYLYVLVNVIPEALDPVGSSNALQGLAMGALCGLAVLGAGAFKSRLAFAMVGFICCTAAGAIGGLIAAGPIAAVFVWLLVRKEPAPSTDTQ